MASRIGERLNDVSRRIAAIKNIISRGESVCRNEQWDDIKDFEWLCQLVDAMDRSAAMHFQNRGMNWPAMVEAELSRIQAEQKGGNNEVAE